MGQGKREGRFRPTLEILEDRTLLDTVRWLGGSGNWSDPAKWSPHLPGSADAVIIDASGANYTVTLDVNPTIAGFTLNSASATFFSSGRTLTVNGPANLSAGTALWRASTWAGSGTLTNTANLVAQASSLISSAFVQNGTLRVQGGAGDVGGHANLTAANGISNGGTIILEALSGGFSSNLTVNAGTLTNTSTGVINVNPDSGSGSRTLSANLTNNGTVNLNTATVFSRSNGVYTNTGAFNIAAGQTLTISGSGQVFNQNGGTLNNAGSLAFSNAIFNFNGGAPTGSPLLLTSAALNIGSGGTAAASFIVRLDSTLSGNLMAGQTLWVQGGGGGGFGGHTTLTAANGFSNAGTIRLESLGGGYSSNLTVNAGTLTNTGVINVNPDPGHGSHTLSASLTNMGTLNLNADTIFSRTNGVYTNSGAFNIAAGQTLTISGSGQVFNQNAGTLNNAGSFALSSAVFNFNGGAPTASPLPLTSAALNIGPAATAAASFIVRLDSTLSGNLVAGQTLWVQGGGGGVFGGHTTLTAANGFSNAGTIRLESLGGGYSSNLTVSAGTLTNTGVINVNPDSGGGNRTISAQLDNQGTLSVNADLAITKDNAADNNSGTLIINAGTVSVNQSGPSPSFTNTGTLDVEAGAFRITAGALRLGGSGILRSTSAGTINIGGDLLGRTTNADRFSLLGPVVFSGPGSAQSPQFLEVTSRDQGNMSQGFARNFAYGTLTLANNTYVRLVNNSGETRVLYVNSLNVPSGTTLDLNGLSLYARVYQINGTLVGGTINQPPPGPLTLGVPAGGFIADQAMDQWTIFGRAGQLVSVIVNTNPGLNFAHVRILDPNGGVIGDQTNDQSGADVSFLGQRLPLDGIYTIQVSAGRPGGRGAYGIVAASATILDTPLNFNQRITGQIDTPFRIDRWNFAAAAGSPIQFDLLGRASSGIRFDLTGPGGYTRTNLSDGDLLTLPNAGNYVLRVSSGNQATGAYAFRVRPNSISDLVLGTRFNGRLEGSGQALLFRVNVPEAKQMLVDLRDSTGADRNELYVKFGSAPTRADYLYRYANAASANQQIVVPTAAIGTWYILVYGERLSAPSNFTLLAATSGVLLTQVTPDHAGNGTDASLTLTGAGFDRTTMVSLRGDVMTYPADTIAVDLPTQITATFRAGTVPPGIYTVVARQPGGDASELPLGFRMLAGGRATLRTNVVVPGFLGNHGLATLYVEYGNTGDVAMPAPLLVLRPARDGRPGAILTLDQSRLTQGFWTSSLPDGFSNTVQILASGATPGILQPGESIRVPVYYAGWQQPWTGSDFIFTVEPLTKDDTRPIDWTSLREGLRPSSIPAETWDPIFTNLVARTGTTWGSYVAMLDANASYLGRLGHGNFDASRLWDFSVQQAIGTSPITHLGDAHDAFVAAPGLPLVFGRFFSPSIPGRYELGPLGRGWIWSGGWQRTLNVAPDGTVIIKQVADRQRRFQPDSRPGGAYFAPPGDHGQLTNLGGAVYSLREPDGLITRFRPDGRIDFVEDPNGNRITAGYTGSQLTRLTHSADPAHLFLQIDYNAAGRVQYLTDPAGRRTTFNYDPSNEYLMSVQTFDGLVTVYDYDRGTDPRKKHALLVIQAPDNSHEFFGYDPQGQLNDVHLDNNAQRVTLTYSLGTVVATDAASHSTQAFFDERGLPAKVLDPSLNPGYFFYDNAFNLTQFTDALGQAYRYQYDGNGNVSMYVDPLGNSTSFVYGGPFNRLLSMTEPLGYTSRYDYDSKGNLRTIRYPDNSVEQFTPDPFGNPIMRTNRRGTPIRYERDAAGRVRKEIFVDGSHIDYNYDEVRGIMLSATDASGTTTLGHEDPQHPDRLTRITYPGGRFLRFDYDDAGRRRQLVDQGGFTVKYRYDSVGRLERLLDGSDNTIVRYSYDPTGRLQRKDMGNSTYTTYDYSPNGQVEHLVNYAANGTINSRFDYTYDALGRTSTMTTLEGLWRYGYDGDGQLTSVQLPNGRRIEYHFDADGNRTSVVDNSVTTTYRSNILDQYVTVGSVGYGYDADGNLISIRDGDNISTFSYDDRNRLIRAVTPQGTWAYEYDVFGNRRASTVNGQRTEYLIDPSGLGDVVGEYNGTGGLISHYTWALGLTSRVDASNAAAYYDFDALGSTVGLTGSAGRYVNRYSYLPFGERLTSNETVPNPFAFVGQFGVQNDQSNLLFMRARFYDSGLGHFISPDPSNIAGGTNLYAYGANQPVTYTDSSGLSVCSDIRVGIWTVGGDVVGGPVGALVGLIIGAFRGGQCEDPQKQQMEQMQQQMEQMQQQMEQMQQQMEQMQQEPPPDPPSRRDPFLPPRDPFVPPTFPPGGGPGSRPPSNPPTTPPCPSCGGGSSRTARSADPNEKTGPSGYGAANFISVARALPYRIDFENDPTATAPAQRVDIRDQLASTLDWDTFQLTEVGFGDLLLTVPAGTRHFQTTVSRTYNNHTFDVQIEIGLNSDIGQLSAAFQSIDPATNLPPDVLTGFLPPENGTGRGMGHISYTILPKANVTTGTQIRNIALVTFDLGEMIATNQVDPHDPSRGTDPNKEALVTIDAVPPTSSVARLPNTSLPNFIVSWAGSDDPGGSGLAFFDIFVSTDGGDFVPWLVHTTLTAAIFQAEVGRTYGFYSVATDNAGNREATPTSAQARTTVANAAANFSIVVNAKSVVAGQPFSITVTALDADGNVITDFAGTAHFDSSDRTPGLPDDYTFTADDAGAHTFDGVTLFRAGAQWVRAVDTDTAIGGYTIITVVPATADHFRVAAVNRVRSGMPFDITITALDPYDNVDVNYGGTVTFTSTDTDDRVVLPLDYTFTQDDAGSHTFTDTGRGETTLVTAGDQTITVSDGSLSLDILITVDSAGGGRAPRAGGSAIFVARPENAPLAFVPKREAAPIAPRRASESGDVPANARGTVFALEQQGQTVPATRARQVALLDRIFADEMTHSWPSV